jgi:Brp/Blh family beta-carotene 15,15'-monooxygenase
MLDQRLVRTPWDSRAVTRVASYGSMGVLVAVVLVGLLAPRFAAAAGPAVLVVAGVLGLPHGAVDHLAVGWRRGLPGHPHPGLLLGYAVAAVAAAALAVAEPAPAVLVLLVLSAAHFAEGECAFDRLRGGAGLVLPAAAVGTWMVVGPLLLRPVQARPLLVSLDPALPSQLASARLTVLVLATLLVLAGVGVALRAGSWMTAIEVALVVLATAVAPALLVFGAWFAGWHASRHLVRLAALQPDGDGRTRARALARGAAGPTAVAITGVVALVLMTGGLSSGLLVALLALTVPHAAVVAWCGRLPRPSSA